MQTPPTARDSGTFSLTAIVNTFDQCETVVDTIASVLQHPATREIIVVDDGSTDGTWDRVRALAWQHEASVVWRLMQMPRRGGVSCRQCALENAQHRYCLLLGGDFILRDTAAIDTMLEQLRDNVAFVSIYGPHGGMGTIYDRDAVLAVGGFALAFNRFGSGYRDDSDLCYRLRAAGYQGIFLSHLRAAYHHVQALPRGRFARVRYALHRVAVHELDVLLFKRHPAQFRADFDVRFGFIVNPTKDYERATGLWAAGEPFALSSPQGIVLVAGKGIIHRLVVRAGGLTYALALVAVRLKGSCRYRKLLL